MGFLNALAWTVIVLWLLRTMYFSVLQLTDRNPMRIAARQVMAQRTGGWWFLGSIVAALWLVFG
ncbi:MAG: hypothetical protein A3E01_07710 [Gammaproteobacteria bacterium RIFCSPHIGHO2_12_FULL_63_22]|nr:MAG: hypothetical protein A3E01_07710 [Gammaproteobacteria bacterium RIFCSPHIGHO2_12_FULL_63_22]